MANTKKSRRRKGSGTIISRNGWLSIRWREDGKICQESINLKDTKKNRETAVEMLEKKTGLAKFLSQQQRLDLLIKEQEDIAKKIARLKAIATGQGALTLGGLVEAFRKSPYRKDCPPAQLDRYCARLDAFVTWAGAKTPFASIDDAKAAEYSAVLSGKYSGASYNKHVAALKIAWAALSKSAGIDANPWADLARKRNESHTRRALTNEEVAMILAKADGEMRDLINIGVHTGMRLGDCARLKWDNFLKDGFVQVRTAKTGSIVTIPSKRLLAALGRNGTKGYVVPTIAAKLDKPHGIEMLSKAVVETFESAGVQTSIKQAGWKRARADAGFHSLRHTFVTKAIEAGIPVAIVKELVGHTTEQMTSHYSHVAAEAIQSAFSKADL